MASRLEKRLKKVESITMGKACYEALIMSKRKYEKLEKLTAEITMSVLDREWPCSDNCKLCEMFDYRNDSDCKGCPIYEVNGVPYCRETPYVEGFKHESDGDEQHDAAVRFVQIFGKMIEVANVVPRAKTKVKFKD